MQESKVVEKGLIYTKKNYEDILERTWSFMQSKDFNTESRHDIQYIYGIYYDAFAGLLRSGALCSRRTGKDGMPELVVPVGIQEYRCRESIIRALLGEESDDIIEPYENRFSSYAGGRDLVSGLGDAGKEGRREKRLKKNSPEAQILRAKQQAEESQKIADTLRDELKKMKQETLAQVEDAKNQAVDTQIALDAANKKVKEQEDEYHKLEEIHKDFLAKLSAEQQEKRDAVEQVQELQEEIKRLQENGTDDANVVAITHLRRELASVKQENEDLRAGRETSVETLEKEHLQKQLQETEARRKDIAARYESLQKSTADEMLQKEKDLKEALDMAAYAKKTLRQRTEIGAGKIFINAALTACAAGGLAAAVQYFMVP